MARLLALALVGLDWVDAIAGVASEKGEQVLLRHNTHPRDEDEFHHHPEPSSILIDYPTARCRFLMDDEVTYVYWNDRDILHRVSGDLKNFRKVKTISFHEVPGATLAIGGKVNDYAHFHEDFCGKAGFAMKCTSSSKHSPWYDWSTTANNVMAMGKSMDIVPRSWYKHRPHTGLSEFRKPCQSTSHSGYIVDAELGVHVKQIWGRGKYSYFRIKPDIKPKSNDYSTATCKIMMDNELTRVYWNDENVLGHVQGDKSNFNKIKTISFSEVPGATLAIGGKDYDVTGYHSCNKAGFAMKCTSTNNRSPWNNLITNRHNVKAQGVDNPHEPSNWYKKAHSSSEFKMPCSSTSNFAHTVRKNLGEDVEPIWGGNQYSYFRIMQEAPTHIRP